MKEIKSLKEIFSLNNLNSDSLIVFDVDQVLIDPIDRILSRKGETLKKSLLEELGQRYGIEKGHEIYSILVHTRKVRLVEEETPDLIRGLIEQNKKVIALTKFPTGPFGCIPSVEAWRETQLKALGIDFSASFKAHPRIAFPKLQSSLYPALPVFQSGILYTGGGGLTPAQLSKGEVLKAFLSHLDWKPSHLIMVDDVESNVEDVEQACHELGISSEGYHYTYVLNLEDKIDEALARFQFNFLDQHRVWLSDQEALEKMKALKVEG